MRQAGVKEYESWARLVVKEIPDMPISFEVLSNKILEMEREARIISSWGKNIYVKIPIITSKGQSCLPLINTLSNEGIKLNITATFATDQVRNIQECVCPETKTIISVFAGRMADIGIDPEPIMKNASLIIEDEEMLELLWASCREPFNVSQAERCGCNIITVPYTILLKTSFFGKDINMMSLETVRGFASDTEVAGYKL
jgi:transaldolase